MRGAVTGIEGGSGDDVLEAGALGTSIAGGDGDERLSSGPIGGTLAGGPGDDELLGAAADDVLLGGPGRDLLIGGQGLDQAAYYDHSESLTLSMATARMTARPARATTSEPTSSRSAAGTAPT